MIPYEENYQGTDLKASFNTGQTVSRLHRGKLQDVLCLFRRDLATHELSLGNGTELDGYHGTTSNLPMIV